MVKIQDQIGNHLSLNSKPIRIISLVPSITEFLYDLGLEERVSGITKFCVHPMSWRNEKQIIGGTKQQHLKKIKDLNPDLIIASKEENVKSFVDKLSKNCPVYVSDVTDFSTAIQMMIDIGFLTDTEEKARTITQQIKLDFDSLHIAHQRKKVAYCIWKNPWMWAGPDTFISKMLSYSGFTNTISKERYPEINMDEIIKENPDYIFLSSEPFPFHTKHIEQLTTTYPKAKFKIVDGEMFSWYGSRMLKAPKYFNSLLHELKSE
ncbi:ABC transporter substrate-binding protein [Marivirga harenae]|uniref:ABC transporter substrate-binding protein n=1 Tax=Marivirga harenae TaxID=2010992 RepID=UPI0026DF62A7|nr:helical backbone metal receptor [Marivirga harenae]WKV12374.1 helical backbone metal receptor [Marivirga harenae]